MATPILLEWGQSTPDSRLLSKNFEYWESYLPFDGIVIPINKEEYAGRYGDTRYSLLTDDQWPITHKVFTAHKHDIKDYEHVVTELQGAKFQKFKYNFIPVSLYARPGYAFRWFDDGLWKKVLDNIRIVAKIAHDAGVDGLLIDVEQYAGVKFWNFNELKKVFPGEIQTFDEYKALVRQRSQELMKAINAEFPSCEILLSYGASMTYLDGLVIDYVDIEDPWMSKHALLPAFVDGLLMGKDEETVITDGNEPSYYFKKTGEFKGSLDIMQNLTPEYSAIPDKVRSELGVAFGIYPTSKNRFRKMTPSQVLNSVYYALLFTQKYVWIWSEHESFWFKAGDPVIIPDQAYIEFWGETPNAQNSFRKGGKPIDSEKLKSIIRAKEIGIQQRAKGS